MSRTAYLYIDETGNFSASADQMRIVGGLLVVAEGDVAAELRLLHDRVASALAWPIRLHARELVEPGCLLRWHALGGRAQRGRLEANELAALNAAIVAHPQLPPHHDDRRWSTIVKMPGTSQHRPVLRQVGSKLLRRSQAMLRSEFQAWCDDRKRAFMIAAHVDDRVSGGAQAYDIALELALQLAVQTAQSEGVNDVGVEIALPIVQSAEAIRRRAVRACVTDISVIDYDRGSAGLWLADSLLAWIRPLPHAVMGSALHPATAVRTCLRATSSCTVVAPSRMETPFDYFLDAIIQRTGAT